MLEKISFAYGPKQILRDVTFSIEAGEVISINGPSGIGKTTLSRIVAGHVAPSSGRVLLGGRDLTARPSRKIFLVSQDNDLFPWQTTQSHLEFVQRLNRDGADPKMVLRMMQLEEVAHLYPKALSGGMQRRLALARALVLDPQVMILDEVFGAQDQALRNDLIQVLRPHWKSRGTAVLIVSHDKLQVSNRSIELTRM